MKTIRLTALVLGFMLLLYGSLAAGDRYVHIGPNWDALHKLEAPEDGFKVRIKAKTSLEIGDKMTFKATAEKDGRLWIVQVDPDDNPSLIFPNEKMPDNKIKAFTTITVPPEDAAWSIAASEPSGKSIVGAIVTTGDLDLRDVFEGKDMDKALRIVEDEPTWGLAKVVVDVAEEEE